MSTGGLYNINPLAQADIFWNASSLIAQRLFSSKFGSKQEVVFDQVWVVVVGVTILGFLAYRILIDSWLRTENFVSGSAKLALDDILRFTTMYAVVQLLSGGSLTDPTWIKESGLFVGSLVFYDLLLHNLVAERTKNLTVPAQTAINDVLKFGVAFVCHNFALGKEFNQEWMISTAGFLTGVGVYDMFIDKYISGKLTY